MRNTGVFTDVWLPKKSDHKPQARYVDNFKYHPYLHSTKRALGSGIGVVRKAGNKPDGLSKQDNNCPLQRQTIVVRCFVSLFSCDERKLSPLRKVTNC